MNRHYEPAQSSKELIAGALFLCCEWLFLALSLALLAAAAWLAKEVFAASGYNMDIVVVGIVLLLLLAAGSWAAHRAAKSRSRKRLELWSAITLVIPGGLALLFMWLNSVIHFRVG